MARCSGQLRQQPRSVSQLFPVDFWHLHTLIDIAVAKSWNGFADMK